MFSVSLYSVQNFAIHRIRFIFDSSNTLVYRDGPSIECSDMSMSVTGLKKLEWGEWVG